MSILVLGSYSLLLASSNGYRGGKSLVPVVLNKGFMHHAGVSLTLSIMIWRVFERLSAVLVVNLDLPPSATTNFEYALSTDVRLF